MSPPLISFIVTCHNEPEAFLHACLESIRALPLAEGEAEILVVDDGSSSPPTSPPGVRLIRQEQAGLSVARNTGIAHAHGSYVQFVDADDALIPSAYGAVIEHMRQGAADVVMFRMRTGGTVGPDRQECPKSPEYPNSPGSPDSPEYPNGAELLLHRNLRAAAWGYAFRREILGDLRFHPGLLHEDELFTPQLFLRAGSVCELAARAYFYRQHPGTITSAKSPEWIQKRLDDIHFVIMQLCSLENPLLERRVRQLTVDYLQKAWTLTHSPGELRRRVRELRREGLLPLPLRRYSLRYLLASVALRAFRPLL